MPWFVSFAMRRVSFRADDPISGFHISGRLLQVRGILEKIVIVAVYLRVL